MAKRNRFSLLARLWPRTNNVVVQQLYTHALNTPLLVEPGAGERLLGAYLEGDRDIIYGAREAALDASGNQLPHGIGRVAVIDISGALASRPMPGPSGEGPRNYEQLRAEFDEAMADRSIDAIVLRMDSPGGFVAGCFDLTDHIFESRGTKPIVAVVDDMAYSAAYAIAAATDKIYVSRSGGVGSVGVVAYHVDQSVADEMEGIKLTAIYAGAHKTDFSPHAPLSEGARAREQAEVDRLYDIFAESIARYRGMKPEAVRATEALTYNGPLAVKVGFADKVGTFEDALADLAGSEEEQAARRAAAEEEAKRMAEEAARIGKLAAKGALAIAVLDSKLAPALALALMREDIAGADAADRVAHALEVQSICEVAKSDRALSFVKRHTSLEDVRSQVLEDKAAADEARKVDTVLPAKGSGTRVPGVWDKTIESFGGKLQ